MHPLYYWLYTGTSYDNQNSRMTYNNKYINDIHFKFFTDQRKLSWRAETIKKKPMFYFQSGYCFGNK
jgi:hypothetical protein